MKSAPQAAVAAGGTPDEVESRFYEALQHGDIERLMACWADEDEIVCVHPGGPRLVGGAAIRAAFEAMFVRGGLRIRLEDVTRVDAMSSAVHTLVERVTIERPDGSVEAAVVATNVYHRTAQGWRLVVHHASPGAARETRAVEPVAPTVLH